MRRAESEAKHKRPYLEDLIEEGQASVQALVDFNMRLLASFTLQAQQALESLWHTFQKLPYAGTARNGLAGVVGISKAVLLLTEGRVGPAFDSEVRRNLGICRPEVARDWIKALQVASKDIRGFEDAIQCTLQEAAPTRFADLHTGRIYDMVLGPRNAMNNR